MSIFEVLTVVLVLLANVILVKILVPGRAAITLALFHYY